MHFAQESSFKKGYMEGASLNTHFCQDKMEKDVSIVMIEVATLEVLRSMIEVETSIQDRVGLVGKLILHWSTNFLVHSFLT